MGPVFGRVLWAYRNTPHESTKEKPSFLLFGYDCRFPTEAALLPPEPIGYTYISGYQEELVLSLSSAREFAASNIKTAQNRYKRHYDKNAVPSKYQVGDLILIRFLHEETGKQRKLSHPWHGPYRVVECRDPDLVAKKQFFPEEGTIQVHQLRACPCPQLPIRFYWYGGNRISSGGVPQWVERLLQRGPTDVLTQNSAVQHENEATEDHKFDGNGDELQQLDDMFEDEQETDANVDN